MVEKFSWLVHLVAATDYGSKNFENLLCHKIIICVLFEAINTVLKNFLSESFKFCGVKPLNVSDSTESDYQISDTGTQSKEMSLKHSRYDNSLANNKF